MRFRAHPPSSRALAMMPAIAAAILAALFPPGAGAATRAPVVARDAMVVTESPPASWVGAEILRRGGNAIDAAIATHFALAVTYPEAGNLGGGGFMLLRMADGSSEAIDFRETAPAAATRDLFMGPDRRPDPTLSTATVLGTGVPGSVAGMALAHERFGTLDWRELLAPAIRLAAQGFVVDRYLALKLQSARGRLGDDPAARRILLKDGAFWQEGDTLRQPELAATLARIARYGPREFYEGRTADSLIAHMQRLGGILFAEDLRLYRPLVREPLAGSYRGLTVLTMPPPSSGGVALLQMLAMLERFPLGQWGPLSSRSLHVMVESMKRAFADRAEFLGDPDYTPLPITGLLAPAYIDSLAGGIALHAATPSQLAGPGIPAGAAEFYEVSGGRRHPPLPSPEEVEPGDQAPPDVQAPSEQPVPGDQPDLGDPPVPGDEPVPGKQQAPGGEVPFEPEPTPKEAGPWGEEPGDEPKAGQTTHYCIVDAEGNAVAVTTTLNTSFGTGIMVRGAGFLLNNEMDDFAAAPGQPNTYGLIQGEANAVRPFARPLSSMVPTLILRGDSLALALGSPGGPRIINSVLQVILNAVDHEMSLQQAVDAPRVHHQWRPDTLYAEPFALVADVRTTLEAMGHGVGRMGQIGSVQALQVVQLPLGGKLIFGASDSRQNGCAVGLTGGRLVSNCACPPMVPMPEPLREEMSAPRSGQ